MKPSKPVVWLTAMLLCLSAVLLLGLYGPLQPYLSMVKFNAAYTTALSKGDAADPLLHWIKNEAAKHNEPPVDATIDRVWKAIPGYEGRIVDIQATYLKARLVGASPGIEEGFPWVYRTIKPKVELTNLPLQPIYRGNPAKPMVAFMINVAWGDEYLPSMLDTLQDAGVKATFFFDGSWLSKHMDTARNIIVQGHEASNHAYSHPNMSQQTMAKQREEIAKTEALLSQLGVRNVWFAPPSGDYNSNTVKAAAEYGLRTVLWTLDTVDWQKPSPASVVSKVSKEAKPGTLILMHPTAASQGALKGMIEAIQAKGYVLGTVSETLSSERVAD